MIYIPRPTISPKYISYTKRRPTTISIPQRSKSTPPIITSLGVTESVVATVRISSFIECSYFDNCIPSQTIVGRRNVPDVGKSFPCPTSSLKRVRIFPETPTRLTKFPIVPSSRISYPSHSSAKFPVVLSIVCIPASQVQKNFTSLFFLKRGLPVQKFPSSEGTNSSRNSGLFPWSKILSGLGCQTACIPNL